MRFEALEAKMHVFETANNHVILPGMYVVVRLYIRNLHGLVKQTGKFNTTYDEALCDIMLMTAEHLMNNTVKVTYAHYQNNEISLLLAPEDYNFARKTGAIISNLVGEASVKLSFLLETMACFECCIAQLPNLNEVINYFQWRSEDARRKALHANCWNLLKGEGKTNLQATRILEELSFEKKKQLLAEKGVNFYYVPNWHKRGVGLYWQSYQKLANYKGESKPLKTNRIRRDFDLPNLDAYTTFLVNLIKQSNNESKVLTTR